MTKETTILVTDSGLGGLSVFAGLAEGLAQDARYDSIRLIYFNAWPSQYKGYNHYPSMDERAKVFDNALNAMAGFNPDQILIACNTLSVIYPFTPFATKSGAKVTGIIDNGVDMIQEALQEDPKSAVVVFGTPATVEAKTHETALIQRGIPKDRILGQPCKDLAGKIERTPFADETCDLIAHYTKEAGQALSMSEGTVLAALCCTHFGYRQDAFTKGLSPYAPADVRIINPNLGMIQGALKDALPGGSPQITMEIYSRVDWEPARIDAYESLLADKFPGVVDALKAYTLDRELFTINIDGES